MYPHTKFGIPTSKKYRRYGPETRKRDGLMDGRTLRLLYASQSSFGGIKIPSMHRFKLVCIDICQISSYGELHVYTLRKTIEEYLDSVSLTFNAIQNSTNYACII